MLNSVHDKVNLCPHHRLRQYGADLIHIEQGGHGERGESFRHVLPDLPPLRELLGGPVELHLLKAARLVIETEGKQ